MRGVNTSVYNVGKGVAEAYTTAAPITIDRPTKTRAQAYEEMYDKRKKEAFRESVDNFVLTKINDLPEDYSAEKLPNTVRSAIQPVILNARQEYANSARMLAQMKNQAGSAQYLSVMDRMNNSKKTIERLNSNLVDLQELTNEYVDNRSMISKGMNPEKVAALDEIFVNKNYNMQFMPDGTPLYQTQYGALKQEDISKYFLKDSTFSLDVLKQAQSMYSKGAKGIDLSKDQSAYQLLRAQFSTALDKGGPETIKSLMADDLFEGFKLANIPDEIANDPSRADEVKDLILDSIMGHISNVNADGLKQYKSKQTAGTGTGTGTGRGAGTSTSKGGLYVNGIKIGSATAEDIALTSEISQEGLLEVSDKVNQINQQVQQITQGTFEGPLLPGQSRQTFDDQEAAKDIEEILPAYRQQIINIIREDMAPANLDKLRTYDEEFSIYMAGVQSELEEGQKMPSESELKKMFNNVYGVSDFYYESSPYNIDITDPYSVANAYYTFGDFGNASEFYKRNLLLMQRQAQGGAGSAADFNNPAN